MAKFKVLDDDLANSVNCLVLFGRDFLGRFYEESPIFEHENALYKMTMAMDALAHKMQQQDHDFSSIGIRNSVELALTILRAEDILLFHLEETGGIPEQSDSQNEDSDPNKKENEDSEMTDSASTPKNKGAKKTASNPKNKRAKKSASNSKKPGMRGFADKADYISSGEFVRALAEFRWGKARTTKDVAEHFVISEEEVLNIQNSAAYLSEVENIMMTFRSPRKTVSWIDTYPKQFMPERFGKRMAISESVAEVLIDKVYEAMVRAIPDERPEKKGVRLSPLGGVDAVGKP